MLTSFLFDNIYRVLLFFVIFDVQSTGGPLLRAIDEMDTTVGVDYATHLTRLESECSVFKGFLHLSTLECAQIASL